MRDLLKANFYVLGMLRTLGRKYQGIYLFIFIYLCFVIHKAGKGGGLDADSKVVLSLQIHCVSWSVNGSLWQTSTTASLDFTITSLLNHSMLTLNEVSVMAGSTASAAEQWRCMVAGENSEAGRRLDRLLRCQGDTEG